MSPVLKVWDGTQFVEAAGSGGNVVGPSSSTDSAVALFDGETGKRLKNSVIIVDGSGNVTGVVNLTVSGDVAGVGNLNGKVADDLVTGPASSTTNAITRFDGTTGKVVKGSLVTIDDIGNINIANSTVEVTIGRPSTSVPAPFNIAGTEGILGAGGQLRLRGGKGTTSELGHDFVVRNPDNDADLFNINNAGNVDFHAGNLTTTGDASVAGLTTTGTATIGGDMDLQDNLLSNIGGDHRLAATEDVTKTTDTSMADDDDLVTPTLELNTTYLVRAMIFFELESSTPDYKFTFTLPTGSTNIAIACHSYRAEGAPLLREGNVIESSGQVIGISGVGSEITECTGSFRTAGTAGTCDFQWAQRVNNADDTTRRAGSFLHVLRVT